MLPADEASSSTRDVTFRKVRNFSDQIEAIHKSIDQVEKDMTSIEKRIRWIQKVVAWRFGHRL